MGRKIVRFEAGERVMAEGEIASSVFLLWKGSIAISRGSTKLTKISEQGIVIGELAAITGRPRSATVVAVEPSDFIVLDFHPKLVYKTNPEIIDKIDAAVKVRYSMAEAKSKHYIDATAQIRRHILQEALAVKEASKMKSNVDEAVCHKRARDLMDDALEHHGHSDDPRTLRRVAEEYNVDGEYASVIERNPWLDESLALRYIELQDRMMLSTQFDPVACLRERATVTCEMLDLLGEYESLPGVSREMDIIKLEAVVPQPVKEGALKMAAHRNLMMKNSNPDARSITFMERKVAEEIRKQIGASGRDLALIHRAAVALGIEKEYEEELKKSVALSHSSSTYLELPPVKI